MKKVFAVALILALAVSLLAGCSVKPNEVFSADDLPGRRIGVQEGTTGDIYASDYEKEGSVIERYKAGSEAILALKQGKVDCVIIDNEPAKVFVEKNKGLKILEEPFEIEDYAICVKKDNTDLLEKINDALRQLKADGTLQKIIVNYIGDDERGDEAKGSFQYTSPDGLDRPNGTLVMATNAQFPPYEYKESDKIVGLDADMAQAVADILGMTLKIEDIHFDSIITGVQSGKYDIGVAGMTVTEDRLKSVAFTDSYTTATQVIIVRDK